MIRGDFVRLLRSEWTKLRSVNRWVLTLLGVALLTVGLSLFAASGSTTDINDHPPFVIGPTGKPAADSFEFVHQSLAGDGSLTLHIRSIAQRPNQRQPRIDGVVPAIYEETGPWGGPTAGIMIKDGTRSGSSYAAILLSPTNGVRMQADFTTDVAGPSGTGDRWLRLVRTGGTVTGYASADAAAWTKVATLTPHHLPPTTEIGFYVAATPSLLVTRSAGSTSAGTAPNRATAIFDGITLSAATTGDWHADGVAPPFPPDLGPKEVEPSGNASESGGTYTVTGSGKIGPTPPDDDPVSTALFGALAGTMALIAVGALFTTAEYRRGMIRTTFAASPRRGRVLAAKAIVLGGVAFVLGLVGEVVAVLVAQPIMRRNGFGPPAFDPIDLFDPAVLRAVLLTAGVMALTGVFSLALGAVLRHSAAVITLGVVLVLLPAIVATVLPGTPALWLMRTTLAGGFATQRAAPPSVTLAEPWALIGPWTGFAVVAAYAAIALGLAWWRLRRSDA